MSDIISGLTPIQIFFIAMSIIGTILAGNNNSWSWIFSILASVVLLVIGIVQNIPLVTILGIIYILLEIRGAYLWIFKTYRQDRLKTFCCSHCGKESDINGSKQMRREVVSAGKERVKVIPPGKPIRYLTIKSFKTKGMESWKVDF